MKKVIRFIATRRFNFLDIVVISAFAGMLDAGHIFSAFSVLVIGTVVSAAAEVATQ